MEAPSTRQAHIPTTRKSDRIKRPAKANRRGEGDAACAFYMQTSSQVHESLKVALPHITIAMPTDEPAKKFKARVVYDVDNFAASIASTLANQGPGVKPQWAVLPPGSRAHAVYGSVATRYEEGAAVPFAGNVKHIKSVLDNVDDTTTKIHKALVHGDHKRTDSAGTEAEAEAETELGTEVKGERAHCSPCLPAQAHSHIFPPSHTTHVRQVNRPTQPPFYACKTVNDLVHHSTDILKWKGRLQELRAHASALDPLLGRPFMLRVVSLNSHYHPEPQPAPPAFGSIIHAPTNFKT